MFSPLFFLPITSLWFTFSLRASYQTHFKLLSSRLLSLMAEHLDHDDIARSALDTCSLCLERLDASSATYWGPAAPGTRTLQYMLTFCLDPRPAIRKAAQRSVTQVLFQHTLSTGRTSLTKNLADVVVHLSERECKRCSPHELEPAAFLCGLLQRVLPLLPSSAQVRKGRER